MSRRIRRGRAPIDLPVKSPPAATDRLIGHDANGAVFQALVSSLGNAVLDGLTVENFTPNITGATTNPSFSWATRYGALVRLGPLVYVEVFLEWNTRSGGVGGAYITLPSSITVRANQNAPGLAVRATNLDIAPHTWVTGNPRGGESRILLVSSGPAVATAAVPVTALDTSGGNVGLSGVFLTT